jgi:hypothetical protein
MVPRPVSWESGLGRKRKQSGISPTAPRTPKGPDQRLPLILRNLCSRPIKACSKGSRGLSVLLRVGGIFTATTISPSWSWRQCPSHYTIHARRNLPDKELRYLRTVIVTAAIDPCLGCEREPTSVTFGHWASVTLYTASCDLAQCCVFDKQLPGPFLCAPKGLLIANVRS